MAPESNETDTGTRSTVVVVVVLGVAWYHDRSVTLDILRRDVVVSDPDVLTTHTPGLHITMSRVRIASTASTNIARREVRPSPMTPMALR